jgi:hypothetical protein
MNGFCKKRTVVTTCSALILAFKVGPGLAAGISAAGVLANGQSVTLQGSGFGVKPNPKPLYFWDFGNSRTQSSPLGRMTYTGRIRGNLSSAVVAPGAQTALQVEEGGIALAAGPMDGVPFNSPSLYVWIKHRYDFDIDAASGPNGFNLKVFRLWYEWTHDIYVNYHGRGGSLAFAEHTQDTGVWFPWKPRKGAWVIEEYSYQIGGIASSDGVLQYFRNGLAAWSPDARFLMRTDALSQPYSSLYFDQVANNQIAPGTYQYIDSIYVDDTLQRVIVSDERTWNTSVQSGHESHREIQIPVKWNDSEIQLVVRQGSLDTFAHKYLYVLGADGNPISTSGYPVTGVDAPNPPASVTVH